MKESRSKSKKLMRKLFGYLGAGLVFVVLSLRPPDFQTNEAAINFQITSSNDHPGSFVEKWCNLQGAEWYPGGWQERTPHFLLVGVKKAGTTSLFKYLSNHPNMVTPRMKELQLFLPDKFQFLDQENKTLVEDTRRYMCEHHYKSNLTQTDETLLSFEATPGYMFQSTKTTKFILCTCPWVKILVILRNPVDRSWSNYNFYLTHKVRLPAFEKWVQMDMKLLNETGVLNDEKDFAGSTAEYEAWDNYLTVNGRGEGPVGRSMYVIQLEHWYDALRAIGRDPTKEILIVRNEDLERNLQTTMDRIFTWLELPKQKIPPTERKFMTSVYKERYMTNETRAMLEEFFQPYNQRLYDMLGDDWQGVWDPPKTYNAVDEKGSAVQTVNAGEKARKKDVVIKSLTQMLNSPTANVSSVYAIPTYNASVAATFVDKWCEMRNVKEWYPSGEDSWQLRAPYFMLPGVRKSGTTSLANYIMQHPKASRARTKELQFFLNKNFRSKYVRDSDRKTLVKEARLRYEREFRRKELEADPSLFSMDATPGYVFFSTILPQRILCVCPWIKVVIIMRNPVDQVYSNYAFSKRVSGMKITFEDWIAPDFKALEESGFTVSDGKSLSRDQEDEAWTKYLELTGAGQIGRGLYEVQLRHWYQAMRDIGRDPETQIHIVRNEDMKNDLDGEYRKILDFLSLPYHPLKSTEAKVVSNYTGMGLTMKNKTREMLETFFAPYNKRLYKMLGGDWDGYWNPPAIS